MQIVDMICSSIVLLKSIQSRIFQFKKKKLTFKPNFKGFIVTDLRNNIQGISLLLPMQVTTLISAFLFQIGPAKVYF